MVFIYQIVYEKKYGDYHWIYSTTQLLPATFTALEPYKITAVYRIQVPEKMVQTYLDCKQ